MKGDLFHILNRGVEKRAIFLDEEDYLRFVHNFLDFNNDSQTVQSYLRRRSLILKPKEARPLSLSPIVHLLCWSLLKNHYHFLVQEIVDSGASLFSQKNAVGYTLHFNLKNNRSGVLFQGRSKIILIKDDAHFSHIPFYILANPLDIFQPDWREKGVKNVQQAFNFLVKYPWSSLSDLLLDKTDGSATSVNREIFFEIFDTDAEKFIYGFIEWLKDYKEKLTEVALPSVK